MSSGSLVLAVLAAGRSTRMPEANKLLLPFPDQPIVRRSVELALASEIGTVGVVVDALEGPVASALDGLPIQLLENVDAERGAATSVRRAAEWALQLGSDLMLTLADEPTLNSSVLTTLVDHWMATGPVALRARYEDRPGHPVLLSRAVLLEASALDGDIGFRRRFQADGALELAIGEPAPIDIDDESDYQAALARLTH